MRAVTYKTVTIANGASLSGAVDLGSTRLIGIVMPAAWTAANLTFQAAVDGVTYSNLYDDLGNEYTVTASTSRHILIAPDDYIGIQFLKVRSGTSGAAVVQAAARVITLVVRVE